MNPERMLYLVVSGHRRGDYIAERDVSDLDHDSTVRDIRGGQLGEVVHIIEFCIAEKIVTDVTEDILREAGEACRDAPLTGQKAIEARWDHERALRKESRDG